MEAHWVEKNGINIYKGSFHERQEILKALNAEHYKTCIVKWDYYYSEEANVIYL